MNVSQSRNPTATLIVDEYMEKFPNAPSRQIARILRKDHPAIFDTEDTARNLVRYRRGAIGTYNRSKTKHTKPTTPLNPYALPASDENVFEPHEIDVSFKRRAALLADIHFPYYSIPALTLAIKAAKRFDSDLIILNGDQLDCHWLSKFEHDLRARKFKDEVDGMKRLLDRIRDLFPKAEIIWKNGNHDERFEAYMKRKAPELFEIEDFQLENIMGLAEFGIIYVTDKRPIYLGKMAVLHGHEYPNSFAQPVNPARGMFLRAKECVIVGHWHQSSKHTEPTLRNRPIGVWSTGCLCELHPKYMPLNKWNHGFALIETDTDGGFQVQNKEIISGKVQ